MKNTFLRIIPGIQSYKFPKFFPQCLLRPLIAAKVQKSLFFIRKRSLPWTPIFSPWLLRWKDAWDKNPEHDMEIVHIINHYWWFLNIYDVDYQNDQPKKEFCKTTFQYFSIFFELRLTTAVFSLTISCWGPLVSPLTVKDYISMGIGGWAGCHWFSGQKNDRVFMDW